MNVAPEVDSENANTRHIIMPSRPVSIAIISTTLLLTAGCLPHAVVEEATPLWAETPITAVHDGPIKSDDADEALEKIDVSQEAWWKEINDPALAELISIALANSPSMRVVYGRIRQANALAGQAQALRWPTINLEGQVGISRSLSPFAPNPITSLNATASLPIAYELDIFARMAGRAEAADFDAEAANMDASALRLTLAAQVAQSWYDLAEVGQRIALLEKQRQTNATYLELVELRYREGLTSIVDVHQQKQQLTISETQLSNAQNERRVLALRLALTTGVSASGIHRFVAATPKEFPTLSPPPSPNATADLLKSRPDLRATQKRIRAADTRVGATIADRLPVIRLSFTPSYTYLDVDTGMGSVDSSGFTYQGGANLNLPLWDGFVGYERSEQERGRVQELVAQLEEQLMTALIEFHSAHAQENQARTNIDLSKKQLSIANDTLEAARDRYRSGLSDFLPVLTSLRSQQSAELTLLASQKNLISTRLQLHRVVGGTWADELAAPKVSPPREGKQ